MTTGISTAHSVLEPSDTSRWIAGLLVALYAVITITPLVWIILTGFKSPSDAISYPPKVLFEPTTQGYCNLFTTRSRQTPEYIAALPPAADKCDQMARVDSMVVAGKSNYVPRFVNSLIIAFGSTLLSVGFGVMAAYAFSRFKVPLKDDLLFFILGHSSVFAEECDICAAGIGDRTDGLAQKIFNGHTEQLADGVQPLRCRTLAFAHLQLPDIGFAAADSVGHLLERQALGLAQFP